MKPLSEQDHYEVLEVSRGATHDELSLAYQLATTTYGEESLAGYSVFGPGDSAAVRERIELAWRVLSDQEARRAYDEALGQAETVPAVEATDTETSPPQVAPLPPPAPALEAIEESGDDYDGARLRRSRLRQGLEIDDVARQTKVNPTYLRFIEEERFDAHPARVYVRGFVMAFATCVGLDPVAVAGSYLERFDAVRPDRQRWSIEPRGD